MLPFHDRFQANPCSHDCKHVLKRDPYPTIPIFRSEISAKTMRMEPPCPPQGQARQPETPKLHNGMAGRLHKVRDVGEHDERCPEQHLCLLATHGSSLRHGKTPGQAHPFETFKGIFARSRSYRRAQPPTVASAARGCNRCGTSPLVACKLAIDAEYTCACASAQPCAPGMPGRPMRAGARGREPASGGRGSHACRSE